MGDDIHPPTGAGGPDSGTGIGSGSETETESGYGSGSDPLDCGDCAGPAGTKPIAHTDTLEEPISHLCVECYADWVSSLPHETIGSSECLICGKDGEYATTREIPTLSESEPVLVVEGCLRFCEEHVHEFAPVAIGQN